MEKLVSPILQTSLVLRQTCHTHPLKQSQQGGYDDLF